MLTLRGLRCALHTARASSRHAGASVARAPHGTALRQWREAILWRRTPHRNVHSGGSLSQSLPAAQLASETPLKPLTTRQKKIKLQWNVHREIVVDKTPLPEVFARLRTEVAARSGGASHRLRQAIDVFYFNCAQQVAALEPNFVAEVVEYFEASLLQPAQQREAEHTHHPLSESLNEGVFTAVVRLLLAQGDKQRAWEIAHVTASMASGKLHFRSVGPILDFECRAGDFSSALARWRQLKLQEMEWTKTMEDTLVQMVIACRRSHTSGAIEADTTMHELLRDLGLATREISPDNASRLRHAFQACGFLVKVLPDNQSVTPQCGACRTPLAKDAVSDAERLKLLRFIEHNVPLKHKNATTTTKDFLLPFKRWLLHKHKNPKDAVGPRTGRLHFILDGPNIAYLNQNFDNGRFRFDHVDYLVQLLQREGHDVTITIPFAYLEETSRLYIRTKKAKDMRRRGKVATRQRTPEDMATIERWREQNLLFSCRTDQLSDDIFWLYASALLGDEARVVTNDQGRDHVFTLLSHRTSGMTTADLRDTHRLSMDLLDRWRESAIVNIEIQHGELAPAQKLALDTRGVDSGVVIPIENVRLIHPTPFSRVPQLSASGHFHFPIADTKGETATKWLCMQRPPAAAAS